MKLNLVPARTGMTWVKLGVQTFFNQPLALTGLFFMFLAVFTVAGFVPVLGLLVALALVPAASLGLMAATDEASKGRFPMPAVLISAFRAGQAQRKSMLILGGLYAVLFIAMALVTVVIDGGGFAKMYLLGGAMNKETVSAPGFQSAALVFLVMYAPFAMAFWHAPALVHWHGVGPGKSVFFSFIACWRNLGAMVVFCLTWMAVMMGALMFVLLLTGAIGGQELVGIVMVPTTLLLASMFFVSMFFSFKDSFVADDESTAKPVESDGVAS